MPVYFGSGDGYWKNYDDPSDWYYDGETGDEIEIRRELSKEESSDIKMWNSIKPALEKNINYLIKSNSNDLNLLKKLSGLKIIYCSFKEDIIKLLDPISIDFLINLQVLNASYSLISSLPNSIGNLTSLKNLNCSYNDLISLPDSIGKLTLLKRLTCNNNKLTSLPDSICNLSGLIKLDCANNKLESLPELIGNLSSLQVLNCSFNKLVNMSESINNLRALRRLYCWDNQLKNFPTSRYCCMSFLKIKNIKKILNEQLILDLDVISIILYYL